MNNNYKMKNQWKYALLMACMLFGPLTQLLAQVSKGQVLMVNASVQSDGILLSWQARSFTGSYLVYKRSALDNTGWGTLQSTLPSTATSYKDVAATSGKGFDYWVVQSNGTNAISYGYIYAGNNLKETPYKGGIVLLIDSNYRVPLTTEINTLKNDLTAEGWNVSMFYAGRNQTPVQVKAKLLSHISGRSKNKPVTTLMILGHVPVPYSGGFTGDGSNWPPPDGHIEGSGNHTGAWPADGYYGDLNGEWNDVDINMTTGASSRNHNIAGDGKFDPTKFPSSLELEVGRVDLFNMPAFGKSDTLMVRNYLNRDHLWRTGQITTVERGLVDDNFGSLNLASSGLHNFSTFFPIDSVYSNKDYFTELAANDYLWSYGCGAGSYTSCNGIGNTTNFVNTPLKNIFTMLAGSFFGDWDVSNSFLRAPLANNALASSWGGIPKFYFHTMAMGKHMGFGMRVSQNNNGKTYFNGNFNASDSSVHIALMGDPTLCNRHLPPAKGLTAVSVSKRVNLKWNKSKGVFDGYAIYNVDTANNIYVRVNKYIIKDTFYTDSFNYVSGSYRYEVRAIKKETTASGSYYNVGAGAFADVAHVNALSRAEVPRLNFYPNPTTGVLHFNEAGLHSFEVFDMMGRQYEIVQPFGNQEIDMSGLPAGAYIVRCLNASEQEVSVPVIKA